eukprot:11421426-Heterocapsa_arctica.AAC.1
MTWHAQHPRRPGRGQIMVILGRLGCLESSCEVLYSRRQLGKSRFGTPLVMNMWHVSWHEFRVESRADWSTVRAIMLYTLKLTTRLYPPF